MKSERTERATDGLLAPAHLLGGRTPTAAVFICRWADKRIKRLQRIVVKSDDSELNLLGTEESELLKLQIRHWGSVSGLIETMHRVPEWFDRLAKTPQDRELCRAQIDRWREAGCPDVEWPTAACRWAGAGIHLVRYSHSPPSGFVLEQWLPPNDKAQR